VFATSAGNALNASNVRNRVLAPTVKLANEHLEPGSLATIGENLGGRGDDPYPAAPAPTSSASSIMIPAGPRT
jgi:hypothetical protein